MIRCGQETRVIPRILQLRSHWLKSEKESLRLEEAGITKEVSSHSLNEADQFYSMTFFLTIIIYLFGVCIYSFEILSITQVLNSAIAQFCLEIIAKHGDAAQRLCNKDPLTLKMGSYVIELFPNVSHSFQFRLIE